MHRDALRGAPDLSAELRGRLRADARRSATGASDAWGDALPDAVADEFPERQPQGAVAGKWAARAPDGQVLAVEWLRYPPSEPAVKAPCTPDAGQSEARSFAAEAFEHARAQLELRASPRLKLLVERAAARPTTAEAPKLLERLDVEALQALVAARPARLEPCMSALQSLWAKPLWVLAEPAARVELEA